MKNSLNCLERANCSQYEKRNLKFTLLWPVYNVYWFIQNYALIFPMKTKSTANIKLHIIYTYITQYRPQPQTGKHFVHNSWLITIARPPTTYHTKEEEMSIGIDSLHTFCLKVMLIEELITFTSLNSIYLNSTVYRTEYE